MEELFDVFDRSGNYLGVKPKSFCHSNNPGVYHKPVWVWICNSKGEVLLQKRSPNKKWFPNRWDSSATGHVTAGETMISGCQREIFEEIGLNLKEQDIKFVGEYVADAVWEIGQVYKAVADVEIADMSVQVEEVAELKWVTFDELEKLIYTENFMPYDKAYKDWIVKKLK